MTTPHPPPGWYPDPAGGQGQRYWDGWTWHAATAPPRRVASSKMNVIVVVICVWVSGAVGAVALTHGSLRHEATYAESAPSAQSAPVTQIPRPAAAPPPAVAPSPAPTPSAVAAPTPAPTPPPAPLPDSTTFTDSDWAWPGMEYDIFHGGSWFKCSVGFPAWDAAGNRYFISAGHCFRDESGTHYEQVGGAGVYIYRPADHETPIGFEHTFTLAENGMFNDVSLVEMYPGKKLDGNGWQHLPDNPIPANAGDDACLVGLNHTNSTCGTVTATAVHQTATGYSWTEILDNASYCAYPGDSGGAVYNRRGAMGIEITASKQNDPNTSGACFSTFLPIGPILDILRQQTPSLTI